VHPPYFFSIAESNISAPASSLFASQINQQLDNLLEFKLFAGGDNPDFIIRALLFFI